MFKPERRAILGGLGALLAGQAFGQFKRVEGAAPASKDGDATFRVDVNVVNVLATVRDRDGRIVDNLQQTDFTVLEDGREQEIRYFTRQTDLPLTIGLLVDTSFSQRDVLEEERRASFQFLEQVLRPDSDVAFVIRFDAEVELLQDVTASRPLLERALGRLQLPSRQLQQRQYAEAAGNPFQVRIGLPFPGGAGRRRAPGGTGRGGGGPQAAGIGTKLNDAVYLASDEVLATQSGRKAIILLSDGVDYGSKLGNKEAVEAALRAEALVYSIHYGGNSGGGIFSGGRYNGDSGKKVLRAISEQSGGRMFEVSGKQPLSAIFGELQEELRNQYSLGYNPPPGDGAYREIEVRTRDPKLKVQSRAGYYPKRG